MRRFALLALLLCAATAPPVRAATPRVARVPHAAPTGSVLPWIADDWPRAVALARARHLPIFVENWAPW